LIILKIDVGSAVFLISIILFS